MIITIFFYNYYYPPLLTVNVGTGALLINCSLYQVNDRRQKAPLAG